MSAEQAGASGQLDAVLPSLFGSLSPDSLRDLEARFTSVHVQAGSPVIRQGDSGDALYVLLSGRLRAVVRGETGADRPVGEIARGECVGEMSLLTGEPRSATVSAVRDSVLARLSRSDFEDVALRHPEFLLQLSRVIIQRLSRAMSAVPPAARVSAVALVWIGSRGQIPGFTERLLAALAPHGDVAHLGSEKLAELARAGRAPAPPGAEGPEPRLVEWFDRQEQAHRFVLYEADERDGAWTQTCVRQADRVLLVAESSDRCGPMSWNRIPPRAREIDSRREMVLLHRNGSQFPARTRIWLDQLECARHHHVRMDREDDFARLARHLAGRAVTLVFAGGGAKGFAHLGVVRALREAGIPIDGTGGTSIGAIIAASVACDWDVPTLIARHREAFTRADPLGDYSFPPLVSLLRGRRMEALLHRAFQGADLEDLWLPCFCVSSDMSAGDGVVHERGLIERVLRASVSLPGVLPPVVCDGGLHIDGACFDNFPVDTARTLGAGRIIASDLGLQRRDAITFADTPSSARVLWDRLTRRRRLQVPGMIATVVRATILAGLSKRREAVRRADLYFRSPVEDVGLLSWDRFDEAIEIGYRHAVEVLEREGGQFLQGLVGEVVQPAVRQRDSGPIQELWTPLD